MIAGIKWGSPCYINTKNYPTGLCDPTAETGIFIPHKCCQYTRMGKILNIFLLHVFYLKIAFQLLTLLAMQTPTLFFLADDDEDDRILFLEALSQINPAIKCMMAKNGKEALLMLQSDMFVLPDYIFLDLNMPIMNGLKCLMEIKKLALLKHIPVIIYSTSAEEEFKDAGKRLGALDFFVKPSDFGGLLKYLKKMLN